MLSGSCWCFEVAVDVEIAVDAAVAVGAQKQLSVVVEMESRTDVIMIKDENKERVRKGLSLEQAKSGKRGERRGVCGKRSDPNSRRHQKGQRILCVLCV